jgi:hypothetical protein
LNKLILSALALCLTLNSAATANPDLKDYTLSNSRQAFQAGDAAMMASWSTYMSTLPVQQGAQCQEKKTVSIRSIRKYLNNNVYYC